MSKLLICKSHQCTVLFEHLLVDLLDFMQPYLRNANLTDSVRMLYKGTLRVLLVLLHDFPEFLCEFHFSFCNVIPPTCIQMRNLILSAFPRSMRLPDPFTPNLKVCMSSCLYATPYQHHPHKNHHYHHHHHHHHHHHLLTSSLTQVDMLPDIAQPPRILSDLTAQLAHHRQTLLAPLDSYLKNRAPPTFPGQIRHQLLLTRAAQVKEAGTKYNVPLINSLVLYVGCQGIAKLQSKSGMVSQFQDNACMDIFEVHPSLSSVCCLLSAVLLSSGCCLVFYQTPPRIHTDSPTAGARDDFGRRGALLRPQRHRQPAALPEQPHALLQLRAAVLVLAVEAIDRHGADYARLGIIVTPLLHCCCTV
jgi:CCR4-NOT transcription complex subunit 1